MPVLVARKSLFCFGPCSQCFNCTPQGLQIVSCMARSTRHDMLKLFSRVVAIVISLCAWLLQHDAEACTDESMMLAEVQSPL